MFKRISHALAASALITSALVGTAQASETINFGIISTESSQNLKSLWDPFLADMSKQTGYEINAFFAPDYAGIIQGMRFDKVDVAWYGNKSAIEAVDRANGEVFAQTVDANGAAGYHSLLVAHKDSPINTVSDMLANAKNLNFANGDPNSTSGYLVPGYYVFAQNGVDANSIFKRVISGSHEVNALSVANRQVDVGTFNTDAMDRITQTAPDKAAQLKVIWTSPLIASDPLVWRTTLSKNTRAKLYDFFMSYGDQPEEAKILAALQWQKFKPSSNDQLLPTRQLELFKKRAEVAAHKDIANDVKEKQLAELDAELKALEARMAQLAQNASETH